MSSLPFAPDLPRGARFERQHGIAPALAATGAWLACAAIMLWLFAPSIAQLNFMDTDDAMRLQQVRDWLGGQAWFDVSQHRINPPTGGPMHWSRLVDAPIAGLILLLRPLLGPSTAEMVACALVPLLTLGLACAAIYRVARRVADGQTAALTVILAVTTPTILLQFTPIRIDHHGWQAVMAVLALLGAIDRRPTRGGMIAAIALACWLQISTEGLPYTAMIGALFVVRYWIDPREAARLSPFAVTLGIGAPAIVALTKGMGVLMQTQCDALSAVYAWPLALFGAVIGGGIAWRDQSHLTDRVIIALVAGGAAAALLGWLGIECLTKGPFHELTPIAYQHWYLNVMEGRPLWEQDLSLAGISLLPSIVGLMSTIVAARSVRDRPIRQGWIVIGVILLGATAISVLVMRAMLVAQIIALPGTAWALTRLIPWAQSRSAAPARIAFSVGLLAMTPVGISALWSKIASAVEPASSIVKTDCRSPAALAPLNSLPPSLLFAPLDIGPHILIHTRHDIIGTGHHRNVIGINLVTHAFLASPHEARADVMAVGNGHGADYVVLCPRMNEILLYAKDAPDGLAARLSRGQVPDWLEPVPTRGVMRIYRVRRP